jgi:hypothetical protein
MADPPREILASPPAQAVAYLFPERFTNASSIHERKYPGFDTFVFQYWPESVSDSHPTNYASKEIPGGTLPLHQWTGGGERTISFDAVFTSELADANSVRSAKHQGIPSSRYTVDVKAAIARLESLKLPEYPRSGQNGRVTPPERLVLVFPGTNLGRNKDSVLTVLKDVSWNYESWFPDGTPRVVQASLTFSESAQRSARQGSNIRFIGRSAYTTTLLSKYNFNRGNAARA